MRSYDQLIREVRKPREIKIDISKVICSQLTLKMPHVLKGIKDHQLTINSKPIHLTEIVVKPNIIVKFQDIIIELDSYLKTVDFNLYLELVQKELQITSLTDLVTAVKKPFCSYMVAYLANNNFEGSNITESPYFDTVIFELETLYKDNFKNERESKTPRRKDLVEFLTKKRTDSLQELTDVVAKLTSGLFNRTLFKFLQEYNRSIQQPGFTQLVAPLLSSTLYSRSTIEALLRPINEASTKTEVDEKFTHFESTKEIYNSYSILLDGDNAIHRKCFKPLYNYLFALLKTECQTADVKPAIISLSPTSRKYNFSIQNRKSFDLFLSVQNLGDGLAREVTLKALNDTFSFESYSIGTLKPGEQRDLIVDAHYNNLKDNNYLEAHITWLDGSGTEKTGNYKVNFQSQNADVPWDDLEKIKPYTIQEIDEPKKLYGRDQILRELEHNILSEKIESYKLWGQKRVGKSSIVKTLRTLFSEYEKIIVVWRPIAGLKNIDPVLTLNTLGESLCSEIFEELERKFTDPVKRENLKSIEVPEFNGSLLPLELYIKKLRRLDNQLKFVFIVDEFDRINDEFFVPGNIGDTFSLNVGKGLNSLSYVGFILVGSENMHLLDRQEMNYNNFQGREVDTFDKKTEFDSYKNIIVGPVFPHITYTSDAIDAIYEATNGNPYFANLICSNIFKICAAYRDNEVDAMIVNRALNMIVESSQKAHFEHFWGDGITEDSSVKKERKADIRRRILVSYSLIYFQTKEFPSKEQIIRNFKRPVEFTVEQYEIENTIAEFFNRKVFFDDPGGTIRIKPALFEQWLCGPGRTLMIEGVSDLEALQREKQLEAEHALKQEEIQRICDNYLFKGEKLRFNEVVNYLNQFGSPFEQRRIFKLLDSLFYITKAEITEFFRREQKNLFRKNELEIKSGVSIPKRENVEIFSFLKTLKENKDLVDTFKNLSLIRTSKTLKDIAAQKDAWKQSGADDLIIFESVIDNFSDIRSDLFQFLDERIHTEKIPVKLVVLLITTKAKADLIKGTSGFPNFRLIHFKEIDDSKIKPFINTTEIFENSKESNYSFAESKKHFHKTSKESISVLFETHCPGKSIPILWHSTSQFKSLFPNPHGIVYEENQKDEREVYRDRVYQTTKEFIQAVNPFVTSFLKNKAASLGLIGDENWFNTELIPSTCMKSINEKWIMENCKHSKETYFDLIDYKEVIKKNKEITDLFKIPESRSGGNGLEWFDKINEIRRTAAHQEKAPPTKEQAEFFEQKKDEIIRRIETYKDQQAVTT